MIAVDDRGRGARLARRDEGAYCWYVTEEQRSQAGLNIRHFFAQLGWVFPEAGFGGTRPAQRVRWRNPRVPADGAES